MANQVLSEDGAMFMIHDVVISGLFRGERLWGWRDLRICLYGAELERSEC
jgi:hypothetical protein